jgi:hypothetical protein
MILFVFEGKREKNFFKALGPLFFGEKTSVVAVYDCNIDALYHEMVELGEGADIAAILMSRYKGQKNDPFAGVNRSDDFSEIYLVFDYDFHDKSRSPEDFNNQLSYLLDFFDNETDKGKLYINYPMVEAIAYTKQIPDPDYIYYTVTREECGKFKRLTHFFSYYPNFDFIIRGERDSLLKTWNELKEQNVKKARYMCESSLFDQKAILNAQITKYECLEGCKIAVLAAFALLIFDWNGK